MSALSTETTGLLRAKRANGDHNDDEECTYTTDGTKCVGLGKLLLIGLTLVVVALNCLHWKPHHHENRADVAKTTRSKYQRVQYIGFQIYTGAAPAVLDNNNRTVLNPECRSTSSYGNMVGEEQDTLQCYIGLPDPTADIAQRLGILRDALEVAHRQVTRQQQDNDTILKIFVTPEFYWRGMQGAYEFAQEEPDNPDICGPVCQLLQGLEAVVADPRFKDWLFVFGTVVAWEELPSNSNNNNNSTTTTSTANDMNHLFYNFAPLYKGYDPTSQTHTGKRFIVPKRYVSSSDFLTPQRHLDPSVYKELLGNALPLSNTVRNPHDFNQRRYNHEMWLNYKEELHQLGYAMVEYDWFFMDGLSMTLEICFDHNMRTALNSWTGDQITGGHTRIPSSTDDTGLAYVGMPSYQAQISLVASAGMQVTPESLVLTDGGVMFLQDGLDNETNRMYWSQEGCELGLQFEGGTEAVQRNVFLSPTDVVFEHTVLTKRTRHDLYHPDDVGTKLEGSFSSKVYPPQVVIFDAVDIAKV